MSRQFWFRAGIGAITVVLAACSGAATPSPSVSSAPSTATAAAAAASPSASAGFSCAGKNIAYASFGSQFPFIALVDKSVKDAATKAGVNLTFLDNAFDADKALIHANLIASRGDINLALEFNYYQQSNLVLSEVFSAAKIPVIAIDIPVPGATFYGANNYEAGKLAGKGLVDCPRPYPRHSTSSSATRSCRAPWALSSPPSPPDQADRMGPLPQRCEPLGAGRVSDPLLARGERREARGERREARGERRFCLMIELMPNRTVRRSG
jgi:ABC-type sugar transport system substrate-binding protein